MMLFGTAAFRVAASGSSGHPPGIAWLLLLIFEGIIFSSGIAICWRLFAQRFRGFKGRNWPTVTATIDDFTVEESELPGRGRNVTLYEAVLQYVFHNPEMQIGEFRREFGERSDAEDWANSFKGCTVKVHVDPKDPQNSVLRKEDLDNAAFPQTGPSLTTSH